MSTANLTLIADAEIGNLKSKLNDAGNSVKKFSDQSTKAFSGLASGSGKSIFNLTEKLKGLQSAVFTEKDVNKIKVYNAEIQATQKELGALQTVGTSSFGNLGAGATKAFSAVRQIAYILPGVGIAGILAFAAEPVIKYAEALFDVTDKVKKAQAASEEFKKTKQSIFSDSGKEAADVASLIVVLKSETETRERKLAALQALKKINPDIFDGLKLEEGAVKGVDAAYKAYLDNLKIVLAAKITQAKLEKAITTLLDLQGTATTTNQKAISDAFKKTADERAKFLRNAGNGAGADALEGFQKSFDNLNASKIEAVQGQIAALLKDLNEFSKGIKIDPEKTDKAKKDIESIADVIGKLDRELSSIDAVGIALGKSTEQTVKQKIAAITSVVERLIKDFKVSPDDTIIAQLIGDKNSVLFAGDRAFENLKDLDFRTQLQKVIQADVNRAPTEIKIPILPVIVLPPVKGNLIEIQKFEDQVTAAMQQMAVNISVAFGEAIAGAFDGLSGGSIFAKFFSSIFKTLGAAIKQLGIYAVTSSKLILAIKATLGTTLGIAGGIALIALGTIISAAASRIKVPAFANGVQNFSGGVALVGERGPELVNLPRGTDVIPNHQIGSIGGGQQIFISSTTVRGQDLLIAYNRANQTYSRNS